jgi:hypothetical protein
MRMKTLLVVVAVMAGSISRAQSSSGGSFALQGNAINGGGGTSSGGSFSLTGIVGQAGAGTLSGGSFQLIGGFVGLYALPTVGGDATLSITRLGDNAVITWDRDGYVLEARPVLGPPDGWRPVTPAPTGRSHSTLFNQAAQFYRLRRQ